MLFYNFLSFIAVLLYSPFLLFKKGPDDRIRFIKERFGISDYAKTDVWVHAVSVGEVIACVPFLKTLKKGFPEKSVVLSTTTYTGQKVAQERFPEADRIMYMPCDTGLCVRRAVNSIRPEIFITIETELWPALFFALKQGGSRIIILNGRLSNRSFKGYRRFRFFMKKLLSYVDFLYMQGETDAEKIITVGADRDKVGVMGNFKFDVSFDVSKPLDWLENIEGDILLAASTHKDEEEIILDAYDPIRQKYPNLILMIAPRHPERFDEVAGILKKRNVDFIRRSTMDIKAKGAMPLQKSFDIILLDTIGELSRVFSRVTIAFVGGSLVPVGGHNILEPAYWSKPIIFGPYMDNFPVAAEFLEESAAMRVKDADEITRKTINLLDDKDLSRRMGQNAKTIVERHAGAVEKAIKLVGGFIGTA